MGVAKDWWRRVEEEDVPFVSSCVRYFFVLKSSYTAQEMPVNLTTACRDVGTLQRTLPVFLCVTILETVTVTVLFIAPRFVTTPVKVAGGILRL